MNQSWITGQGTLITSVIIAFVSTSPVAAQNELSVEQANAAFMIAEDTAAAGLGKLSTNAVARALQFGPPRRSEQDGQNPLIFRSVVVDIYQSIPESPVVKFQRSLPSKLLGLSQTWANFSVSPEDVYEALRVCVNPPGRPDQLFLYPVNNYTNLAFPAPVDRRCIACELVKWAARAGQIGELRRSFEVQQLDVVAEGSFVFLLIALEQEDQKQIEIRCQQLSRFVRRATSSELLRLLAATLLQADRDVQSLAAVQDLLHSISLTLLSVDPQTAGESTFAVTVASRSWQLRLRTLRPIADSDDIQKVLASGNDLIAREGSLPRALASILSASLADSVLIFDLAKHIPDGALKNAVLNRQVRFPASRRIEAAATDPEQQASLPEGIVVHWNVDAIKHRDALWCQALNFDQIGQSSEPQNLFAISGLQSIAHPTANFDGSLVAFHGHQPGSAPGSGAHIYLVDRKNQTVKDLGPGVQPSLSPTGDRLTCSRYTPNKGVWLVRSDGTNWDLLDEHGWGSRFSSDGSAIAFSLPQQRRHPNGPHSGNADRRQSEIVPRYQPLEGRNTLLNLFPVTLPKPGLAVFCLDGNAQGWVGTTNSTSLEQVAFGNQSRKQGMKGNVTLSSTLISDLHAVGPSDFVWLGTKNRGVNEKEVYWSGEENPLRLKNRLPLGIHVTGQRQLIILSKKGAS